jgi:hypothetical protein
MPALVVTMRTALGRENDAAKLIWLKPPGTKQALL